MAAVAVPRYNLWRLGLLRDLSTYESRDNARLVAFDSLGPPTLVDVERQLTSLTVA